MSIFKELRRKNFSEDCPRIRGVARQIDPVSTIFVDATNVADELRDFYPGGAWLNMHDVPCMTPVHRSMWIEFSQQSNHHTRVALFLNRVETGSGFSVSVCCIQTMDPPCDKPEVLCEATLQLDPLGRLVSVPKVTWAIWDEGYNLAVLKAEEALDECDSNLRLMDSTLQRGRYKQAHAYAHLAEIHTQKASADLKIAKSLTPKLMGNIMTVLADALCRMNCNSIVLKAVCEPKRQLRWKPRLYPATVWHTIEVASEEEKYLTTGRAFGVYDESMRRQYMVRAHYADYREGAGLFGKHKVLIWVPDHKCGNPALGQVIPEYVVH